MGFKLGFLLIALFLSGSECFTQIISIRNETTNMLLNQLLSQAKADKQAYDQKFDLYIGSLQKLIEDLENSTEAESNSTEINSKVFENRMNQLETKLSTQIEAVSKTTNKNFAAIESKFSEDLEQSINSMNRKLGIIEKRLLIQDEKFQNLSARLTVLGLHYLTNFPNPGENSNVETIEIQLKTKPTNNNNNNNNNAETIDIVEPEENEKPLLPLPNPSPVSPSTQINETESESGSGQDLEGGQSDPEPIYKDCCEAYKNGKRSTGTYKLKMFKNKSLTVVCDMTTEGGGWTVVQRRILEGPVVSFNRNWTEYEEGFGSAPYTYWLGLKHIYELTKTVEQEVRFDMEAFPGTNKKGKAFAKYKKFHVAGPGSMYKLTIDNYYGNAGNSMMRSYPDLELSGMYFTTIDKDNDLSSVENCANGRGGWWHNQCSAANVNGLLYTAQTYDPKSLSWHTFNSWNSLKFMEMKVRNKKSALCGVSAQKVDE